MSDLAKKIFEKHREELLESSTNIDELCTSLEITGDNISAYLLILNPDHPQYDEKLTCLETDHQMQSAGYSTVHAGFIEKEGEAARVGIFESFFPKEKLRQVLGEVLFDVYQIK